MRAYVERCIAVNPELNAIVDQRYDTAIEEARKVDEFFASTSTTEEELAREKPLLGVPITVKESFAVKGSFNRAPTFSMDHILEQNGDQSEENSLNTYPMTYSLSTVYLNTNNPGC